MEKEHAMLIALAELADDCLAKAKQITMELSEAHNEKGEAPQELAFWAAAAVLGAKLGSAEAMQNTIARAEAIQKYGESNNGY